MNTTNVGSTRLRSLEPTYVIPHSAFRIAQSSGGFTLLDTVVGIVILGIAVAAMVLPMSATLRNAPNPHAADIAIMLAEERMDLILARKYSMGFASFTDPCPGPSLCTVPAGFTVVSSIVGNWQGNTNYKEIVITVSGSGDAVIRTLVGNYL